MLKTFGAALWVMVAISAASDPASLYGTLESGQCYTWGINPRITLPLHSGQIITEAALTVHNIRPDDADAEPDPESSGYIPRSSARPGALPESPPSDTPVYDSLRFYILNNPRFGYLPLNRQPQDDPFAQFGGLLTAEYEQGDLICRLSRTHDPDRWAADIFGDGEPVALTLTNGETVALSSALLEFIDYAGTGPGVGFGIQSGSVRFLYDDITLSLTVQSYDGAYPDQTIVCHIADIVVPEITYTLITAAVNGSISVSPDEPAYSNGQAVTLTAVPNSGYTFAGWSGDITGSANHVTVTMDGDKLITANFSYLSRSSPRGP